MVRPHGNILIYVEKCKKVMLWYIDLRWGLAMQSNPPLVADWEMHNDSGAYWYWNLSLCNEGENKVLTKLSSKGGMSKNVNNLPPKKLKLSVMLKILKARYSTFNTSLLMVSQNSTCLNNYV